MIEIAQSEDRCYMWRIHVDDMWFGGYTTYQLALDAAIIAFGGKYVS